MELTRRSFLKALGITTAAAAAPAVVAGKGLEFTPIAEVTNFPPTHVNCRSQAIPIIDRILTPRQIEIGCRDYAQAVFDPLGEGRMVASRPKSSSVSIEFECTPEVMELLREDIEGNEPHSYCFKLTTGESVFVTGHVMILATTNMCEEYTIGTATFEALEEQVRIEYEA